MSQYCGPMGRPRDVEGMVESSSPGRIMSREESGASGKVRMYGTVVRERRRETKVGGYMCVCMSTMTMVDYLEV